jgi:signal recognition particle subunit SRP54
MFDNLSDKLNRIMKRVRGEVKFSESNIKEIIREVKLALLEADVHYRVVKDFTNSVREKILGKEVLESLSPSQHFIKIIHTEMVKVLGEKAEAI